MPEPDKIDLLAIWLNASCARMNVRDVFRLVVKDAMREARDTYAVPDDEVPSDEFGVLEALAQFATKLDEVERIRLEDERQDNDPIGYLSETLKYWCLGCAKRLNQDHKWTPICRANIGTYSQSCYQCGTLVVDGLRKKDNSPLDLY